MSRSGSSLTLDGHPQIALENIRRTSCTTVPDSGAYVSPQTVAHLSVQLAHENDLSFKNPGEQRSSRRDASLSPRLPGHVWPAIGSVRGRPVSDGAATIQRLNVGKLVFGRNRKCFEIKKLYVLGRQPQGHVAIISESMSVLYRPRSSQGEEATAWITSCGPTTRQLACSIGPHGQSLTSRSTLRFGRSRDRHNSRSRKANHYGYHSYIACITLVSPPVVNKRNYCPLVAQIARQKVLTAASIHSVPVNLKPRMQDDAWHCPATH